MTIRINKPARKFYLSFSLELDIFAAFVAAWREWRWFEIKWGRPTSGIPLWDPFWVYHVCLWLHSKDTCNFYKV